MGHRKFGEDTRTDAERDADLKAAADAHEPTIVTSDGIYYNLHTGESNGAWELKHPAAIVIGTALPAWYIDLGDIASTPSSVFPSE